MFNPLNAELNPICHLLALLGAHYILHISRIRVNGYFEILSSLVSPSKHHATDHSRHVHLSVLYFRTFACLVKFLLFCIV
jgi:hypothetical protein